MAQRGLIVSLSHGDGLLMAMNRKCLPSCPAHCVMGAAPDSTQPCSMTDGCQGELSELNNLDTRSGSQRWLRMPFRA